MSKNNFLLIYVLFPFILLSSSCNSQTKPAKYNNKATGEVVTTLDDKIWSIFQDQKGDFWFGSNGRGLYHYSASPNDSIGRGKELRLYTILDGLVDNTIRGIQGDHLGNVFIQTPHGVSKYDGKTFTTLRPKEYLTNDWKLAPTDLWFNCNGSPNDVYRYDGESLYELQLPRQDLAEAFGIEVSGLSFSGMNHSPYSVYGLDKDKAGNLWIGTVTAGAFRYDGKSFLWVAEKELSTLPDGRVPGVRSILEDKDGFMWLSNFVSKYKVNKNNSITIYEKLKGIDESHEALQDRLPYFNSGLSDENGDLWMTTYGGGVWKYDGKELRFFPVQNGEMEVLIISIYEDQEGVLWLGTDNDGVYRFGEKGFEKFVTTAEL